MAKDIYKGYVLPELDVVANYPYEQRVIDTMNNSDAEFIQRLRNNDRRAIINPDGSYSTHVLGSADNIVFPAIQDINGQLTDYRNLPWQKQMQKAINNKDYIEFPSEGDARYFGEHYKKYFPEYFNSQYAEGGKLDAPKQWDDLSISDKSDVMAAASNNGITNLKDIRQAWNDYADNYEVPVDTTHEDIDDNYIDWSDEANHEYLKGGYKPSASIRNRIANWEGDSMKINRSFEDEARDFWAKIPANVRSKLTK